MVCIRIPKLHKLKLQDLAVFDKITMSQLIRDGIARLLNGRGAALYGRLRCKRMIKDGFGQYRKCRNTDKHTHDDKPKEITK